MKAILLFTVFITVSFYSMSQFDKKLNFIIKEGKANTGNEGVILSITGISENIKADDIILSHLQFEDLIKSDILVNSSVDGLVVRMDIGNSTKLIGRNVILVKKKDLSEIIGFIEVYIGGEVPDVDFYETKANIILGDAGYTRVKFSGHNFDGVTSVVSENNLVSVSNRGILPTGRTDSTFFIDVRGKMEEEENVKFVLTYKASNLGTKLDDLSETYQTLVNIRKSQVSVILPEKKDYFVEDVRASNLILKLTNTHESTYTDYQIPANNAFVEIGGANVIVRSLESDVIIRIYFNNPDLLKPGIYKFPFNRKESSLIKTYTVQFTILAMPEVTSVMNKSIYAKYLISQEKDQTISIEGVRLRGCKLIPSEKSRFKVGDPIIDKDNELEFPIEIIDVNMPEQKYSFDIVTPESNRTIKTIELNFESPRIPNCLDSLYTVVGDNMERLDDKSYKIEVSHAKGKTFSVFLDESKLNRNLGSQSISIAINYYNPDGKIISVGVPQFYGLFPGSNENGPVFSLDNESVIPWGRAEIIISHASDFYLQDLKFKNQKTITIYFIKDPWMPVSVNAAFTIPPALLVYGRQQTTDKLEFLPINVGAGVRLSFIDRENHSLNDYFRLGIYAAGINFVDRSTASGSGGDFIKQGDIAGMVLAEFSLRRTDSYVKVPLFFGPGVTVPIQGATCRAFLVFGIGVTL